MSDSEGSAMGKKQLDPQPTTSARRRRSKPPGDSPSNSGEWSESEKMQLFEAWERYGIQDLKSIGKCLPTKTREQIKVYTRRVIIQAHNMGPNGVDPDEKKTKKCKKPSKAPLDQWMDVFDEAQGRKTDEFREGLARTFLYISRYEPHPDPKDCDGIDYAAMYEFLYLAISGLPVKAVTPETASALLASLDDLAEKVEQYDTRKEQDFLTKVKRLVYVENVSQKSYSRQKGDLGDSPGGPIQRLMDVKGFNPLNIPFQLLKKRPANNEGDQGDEKPGPSTSGASRHSM